MALEIEIERVESGDFSTCGEITTLLSVGKKEFFLNCKFCDFTCLTFENFMEHIYDDHLQQFVDLSLERENSFETTDHSETEMDEIDNSNHSLNFSKSQNDNIGLTYFEKIEIDHLDEGNDTSSAKDFVSEEILSGGSQEEGVYEYEDAEIELSAETSNCTDSDTEISPNGQYKFYKREFDLPENDKKGSYKKFIIELIETYHSLPALWKISSTSYYDRKLKKEQYEILLKKYNKKYPSANEQDLKSKIQRLRTSYRRELKNIGHTGISTLYYFEAMDFLRDILPPSETSKVTRSMESMQDGSKRFSKKFITPPSLLCDEELINLAKIYKKHSCLWDEHDIAYRFANRRREAMKNILNEFNETSKIKLTKFDLEKEVSLLRKLSSNEKKEKIACKRKNISYKPICTYYEEIAYLEVDVTPYECSICQQVFAGVCQCKIHEATHDGSLPFKCQVCGHGFKLVTNLTVHLRRHVQDFTYNCQVCNKPCATTTELRTHMRLHTGEKPFVCDICGKAFPGYAQFVRHRHRHEGKPRFKCEICFKPFYDKRRVRDHMIVHTKVRDHICDFCNRGFANTKHLRQHQLIHNPEKKYECKICLKRFAQCAGLNAHMKSHGTKFTPKDSGNSISEYKM